MGKATLERNQNKKKGGGHSLRNSNIYVAGARSRYIQRKVGRSNHVGERLQVNISGQED